MKTKKEAEKNTNLNSEICYAVQQFINNPKIRQLDESEKLAILLNLTLKAYSSQTRMNTAFIDDLIFIFEDFLNSFSHQSN
ncbi:hypothetical protein D9V86_05185 [Bacteroidetes/Chlorobi group bacterium ChocPot_Mid]|jgi:hypothetical protein|nr:MAG: hypothetical protein D9V86_05185 [Bacteroidetes/Chlorobi group bacterium ChocPot_Mid]